MLSYCTNIHPGEAWADVLANLEAHALAVRDAASPSDPFPLGLRVSGRASQDLDLGEAKRFRDWCQARGCFVASINGFPHGQFHGVGVKQRVYQPDWRDPQRAAYTRRLADLLAEWLPEGVAGSISSVPIAFKRHFDAADDEQWRLVREHLLETLEHLEEIRQQRGVEIALALEPEPRCVLETTPEVVAFFERMRLPDALADLAGVCFDCCHQAVEFEEPAESLATLEGAGIRIAKVQLSSSLRAVGEEIAGLARFDEPSYLHQVVARMQDGSLRRWDDLPDFRSEAPVGVEECRVHFHVPIFAEHLGHCGTTRFFLEEMLPLLRSRGRDLLLEVETYSWDVLPAELRSGTVVESIVRELAWARKEMDAT